MAEKQKLFKHKTFNQQLSEVKINYFKLGERRVGEKDDDDRLSTSYLYSSLEKWIDLDCTEDFSRIIRKLGGLLNITTLAQVLHRKEELIKIFQDELEIKENPSLNSIFELLIALAKDLGDDFYPYFKSTFKLLLNQLWTKNVEIIENVFLTLAYLFKILWKCMIRDIHSIFHLYSDNLLNEQKRDYILVFASQSFAFLLRKFEAKFESYDRLLNLLFDTIIKKPSLVNGISYLLFEVIKGVKNQLNSSANVLLPELIDKQNDKKYSDSLEVKDCVNNFFNSIANYIDKNNVDLIWSVVLDKSAKQIPNGQLLNNLAILQVMVCYKKCVLVIDSNAIIKLLTDVYTQTSHTLDDESTEIINSLVLELLENKISTLSIKNIHQFVTSVVNSKISHLNKLKFFEKLSAYNFFDRDILPELNKFLNEHLSDLNDSTLDTLLKLILANKFVNFKLKIEQKTSDNLLKSFQSAIDLNSIWKYIVILPTIQTIPTDQLSTFLVDLLVKNLNEFNNQTDLERKSFLIFHLQQSIINLNKDNVFNQITPELYINFLNEHPYQLAVLKSFKLYLDNMKKFNVNLSDESRIRFEDLFFNKLQLNLSHQHSQMRKIVLEILIFFTKQNEETVDKELIFSVCLKIEQISFSEPRECQRLINKLDYSNLTTYLPTPKNEKYSYKLTPVYYLLGFYYANYTPFWETIKNVLVNYSTNHKESNEFWKIISDHIKHTDLIIYDSKLNWIDEADFKNDSNLIDLEIIKLHKNEDRPDYLNHRIQLLNLLISTPQLVEKFNRYVVQWFFEFLDNEISILSISPTLYVEDITRLDEPMQVDDDENDEELTELDEKDNEKSPKVNKNRFKIFQTFLKFLKVFGTIKNPLAIYEESKLRSLYYKLLENKDTNIQKAAFDCLKTYRFSFITPYVSNIENLIDINQFKHELVKFSFASRSLEDSLLQDMHRKDVIQVVMRILYGKLIHNFTSSKEGLVDSKLKKKLIFRYISDFREEDIKRFIEIAFNRFVDYFDLDYKDMDVKLDNLDLKQVIPCKQMYASLENLSIILDNLGSIFPNLLSLFYKLIVIFLKYSCKLLSKREMIKRSSLHLLRQIRANCFKCLTTFFKSYPNFNFTSEDIDVIFDTDLERSLIQLPVDSLNYINPQLRLYLVWSEQKKFFKVLGKKLRQTEDIYPLKQIMIIYENRKANNSVVELITKIVDNLINVHLKDEEEQVECNLEVNNVVTLDDQIEIGASLLIPFIDVVINRFEQNMNRKLKSKKSGSQNLVTEIETNILLTIGKYASNEKSCFRLIKLLISSLQKNIVVSRNEGKK